MSEANGPSEEQMRAAMQEYIDAFNRDDLEALVGLYADDATVEDPVGTPLRQGMEAIREFYAGALAMGARLERQGPIRTSQGQEAAMAFQVQVTLDGQPTVIDVIDVMRFDAAGRFSSMRAFWGPGDMRPA